MQKQQRFIILGLVSTVLVGVMWLWVQEEPRLGAHKRRIMPRRLARSVKPKDVRRKADTRKLPQLDAEDLQPIPGLLPTTYFIAALRQPSS